MNRGKTTLRQAIFDANETIGHDTITFDPTVFLDDGVVDTILLTEGQLNVTDEVTIIGPGWDEVTIDASGSANSRVLRIAHGQGLVEIGGVTLTGGNFEPDGPFIRSFDDGAGIQHVGGSLTIRDSVIRDNATDAGRGGGLWSSVSNDDELIVDGVVFQGNTSFNREAAFAITNAGLATIRNSLVVDNITGATLNIDNEFSGDEATGQASLRTNNGGQSRVVGTTFANNLRACDQN